MQNRHLYFKLTAQQPALPLRRQGPPPSPPGPGAVLGTVGTFSGGFRRAPVCWDSCDRGGTPARNRARAVRQRKGRAGPAGSRGVAGPRPAARDPGWNLRPAPGRGRGPEAEGRQPLGRRLQDKERCISGALQACARPVGLKARGPKPFRLGLARPTHGPRPACAASTVSTLPTRDTGAAGISHPHPSRETV